MNKISTKLEEQVYLDNDTQYQVSLLTSETAEKYKMTPEEEDDFMDKCYPVPKMFANVYRGLLGEEEYRQLEQENIEIIKNRAWENEYKRI